MGSERLLFVEGRNDKEVIYRIENRYNLAGICEVKEMGSDVDAYEAFSLYINEQASKADKVGLVIDADQDFNNRWKSIRLALTSTNNYTVPSVFPPEGLVLDSNVPNKPKIGVWIMPNNGSLGMLEDFLREMVPDDDDLIPEVTKALDNLEASGKKRYKDIHRSKAWMHTYLAWQDEPGNTLAVAVASFQLNSSAAIVKSFAGWMTRLYM